MYPSLNGAEPSQRRRVSFSDGNVFAPPGSAVQPANAMPSRRYSAPTCATTRPQSEMIVLARKEGVSIEECAEDGVECKEKLSGDQLKQNVSMTGGNDPMDTAAFLDIVRSLSTLGMDVSTKLSPARMLTVTTQATLSSVLACGTTPVEDPSLVSPFKAAAQPVVDTRRTSSCGSSAPEAASHIDAAHSIPARMLTADPEQVAAGLQTQYSSTATAAQSSCGFPRNYDGDVGSNFQRLALSVKEAYGDAPQVGCGCMFGTASGGWLCYWREAGRNAWTTFTAEEYGGYTKAKKACLQYMLLILP
eukprot:GHVU01151197.1.p1 GENE.GHVU01151197.1~~GHVU01151197.1.p1  ORF type:complete len:304 (+),score=28.42 GHVU01151197.1:1008-1919(+)